MELGAGQAVLGLAFKPAKACFCSQGYRFEPNATDGVNAEIAGANFCPLSHAGWSRSDSLNTPMREQFIVFCA